MFKKECEENAKEENERKRLKVDNDEEDKSQEEESKSKIKEVIDPIKAFQEDMDMEGYTGQKENSLRFKDLINTI